METSTPLASLPVPLAGLALAPEGRRIVAWGQEHIFVLDGGGSVVKKRLVAGPGNVVGVAVDVAGRVYYAAHNRHGLACLGPDLQAVWQKRIRRLVSVATTPFGEYVIVGTQDARLYVLDRYGRRVAHASTMRPPKWLVVAAAEEAVFAGADSTVVSRYDIKLDEVWEERVSSPIGPIACPGNAMYLLVSAYAYGLERYRTDGRYEGNYQIRNGVRLVDVDFDGSTIVAVTLDRHLVVLNALGVVQREIALGDAEPAALCLAPTGELAYYSVENQIFARQIRG